MNYEIVFGKLKGAIATKLNANQGSANAGKVLGIDSDGAVIPVAGLPAVTAADNGKTLKVVNGVWSAV